MFFKLQKENIEHYYDFANFKSCLHYEFVCGSLTREETMLYYEGLKALIDDLIKGFNVVFREV